MNGQPKLPFYIVLFLVIGGLIAFAAYRSDLLAPKGKLHEGPGGGGGAGGTIDPNMLNQQAESKDSTSITTVKEYSFKPAEHLPEVKGTAAYKPLENNTVRFALN